MLQTSDAQQRTVWERTLAAAKEDYLRKKSRSIEIVAKGYQLDNRITETSTERQLECLPNFRKIVGTCFYVQSDNAGAEEIGKMSLSSGLPFKNNQKKMIIDTLCLSYHCCFIFFLRTTLFIIVHYP